MSNKKSCLWCSISSLFAQARLCQVEAAINSDKLGEGQSDIFYFMAELQQAKKPQKNTYSMYDVCWVDILGRDGGEHT